jgi:hypothetical protein
MRLRADQQVLRIRRGTKLQTVDGSVVVRVTAVIETGDGGRFLDVEVEKGVRVSRRPSPGDFLDLVDTVSVDMSFIRDQAYREMARVGHPLVYADQLPAAVGRARLPVDLVAATKRLRRP